MPSLQGRVALVTGASRGIGRAIAERLGREGAKIAITYAGNREKAEVVVATIQSNGGHRGITVNLVSLGVTETDGLIMPADTLEHLIQSTPLGRLGQTADIARCRGVSVL